MRLMPLPGPLLAGLALALSAGCGGDGPRGIVAIDGSSTVFRISKAAQIGYADAPSGRGVQVLLNNSGTGGGFGKYLRGEVDLINASRPAKPEEEEQARANGLDWTRFVVGYDGITVAVHPENAFCEALSVDQLRALFAPDSTITRWNQLDPSFPDLRIVFYTPDNDSGTYEYFVEAIFGEKISPRKDVQASADDNVLVTGIAGDPGGIGYFGYAYYAANTSRLKAVAIRATPESEPVAPTRESILSGAYRPLSRPLFLYAGNGSMRRPEVADFLWYYLTNIEALASRAGYVPPRPEDQAENLEKLPGGPPAGGDPLAGAETTPEASSEVAE